MPVAHTNRSTHARRRVLVVLAVALTWLAAVTLIATRHGAERRMSFNSAPR